MNAEEVVKLVRLALAEELDERNRIDGITHVAHHAFVADLIKCSERRRQMLDAIVRQVGGWSIVALLSWIGYAVYQSAKTALH